MLLFKGVSSYKLNMQVTSTPATQAPELSQSDHSGPRKRSFVSKQTATQLKLIFVLCLVALGMRLIYDQTVVYDGPLRLDAVEYIRYAWNLAEHGIYSRAPVGSMIIIPDAFRTPGYSLFLASIFKLTADPATSFHLILWVQAVIGTLAVLFLYLLAQHLLSQRLAFTTALLFALCPQHIILGAHVLSEVLLSFLLIFGFWLIAHTCRSPGNGVALKIKLFSVGIIFGLSALVHPTALLLTPMIVLAFLFFYPKKIIPLASIVLGFALCWGPWVYWSHTVPPASPQKMTLAKRSLADGMFPYFKSNNMPNFHPLVEKIIMPNYRMDAAYQRMIESVPFALDELRHRVAGDPGQYIHWYLLEKPRIFWAWDLLIGQAQPNIHRVKTSMFTASSIAKGWEKINHAFYPLIIALAIISFGWQLIRYLRDASQKQTWLLLSVVFGCLIYFTVVHMVFVSVPRYSVPLRGLLYLVAFIPIQEIIRYNLARCRGSSVGRATDS